MKVALEVRVRAGWSPGRTLLRRWTQAALGRRGAAVEISVLIVGAAASRRLNRQWRGKDSSTNVLSFPAPPRPAGAAALLGDLVLCPPVLRREARAQGKSERAHWTHLVVHGVLHLLGMDHLGTEQARRMERREVRILQALGVANPYRSGSRIYGQ